MSITKVKVKWSNGKTTLEGVDLDKNESPSVFKAKLLSLTGVPIERQKLMFKGSVIKDESWPDNFEVCDGAMFMLMGSSEKLPEAPVEKPKFEEDMTDIEKLAALDVPAGLSNLGNTCYMSATVQCLKTVPELREALKRCEDKLSLLATLSNEPNSGGVTAALRDLFDTMKSSGIAEPVVLLRMLQSAIPRFAQRGEGNTFQQQDANECWTELTRILQQTLKPLNENSKYSSFIDEYFSGVFEAEMKCDEAPEEPVTKSEESFLQLSCFISQEIRYMQAGLASRMKESITKFSPTLQRDAIYTKTSRINRLPAYLTIQFVRFHYKGNVQTNAKLLRDVKFSFTLDVYDLCSEELQKKLAPMREKYKRADDLLATRKSASKGDKGPPMKRLQSDAASGSLEQKGGSASSSIESSSREDSDALTRFLKDDKDELKRYTFEEDPGSNNSGFYELRAVLTHKGRSSDSGHYVGWIKKEDQWFKCDDEYVEPVDEEEIMKLSGGGDWHCAYVCLYGPRFLDSNDPHTRDEEPVEAAEQKS